METIRGYASAIPHAKCLAPWFALVTATPWSLLARRLLATRPPQNSEEKKGEKKGKEAEKVKDEEEGEGAGEEEKKSSTKLVVGSWRVTKEMAEKAGLHAALASTAAP